MIQILAIVQNKGISVCDIYAKMFDENISSFINFISFETIKDLSKVLVKICTPNSKILNFALVFWVPLTSRNPTTRHFDTRANP